MKIAIVSPYPLDTAGGVQRHVLDYYQQLKNRGCYVKLISPSCKMNMEDHIQLGTTYVIKGGKYLSNNSETYYTRIRKQNPVLPENFDIIHVHEPMLVPPFFYGIKIAQHNPAKYIAHVHAMNPGIFEQLKFISQPLIKHKMKIFDRIFATSIYSAQPYRDAGFGVELIPNGVEISKISPENPKIETYCDEKKNLMFLGRSDERKGLKYLLEAWPMFTDRYGKMIRLIIAGGRTTEEVELMKSWAKDLPYRENIVFEGSVSEERKARLLTTADVFISPATGSESFGMVLNEAMAAGTPVVAFDNPGYRTVLAGREKSTLAELYNINDLVQKTIAILEEKPLRDELIQWGLSEVHTKYDWNIVTEHILEIYQNTLDSE